MVKKITLKSIDGELFEVDEAVASQSKTIKDMISDIIANRVNSQIITHVIAADCVDQEIDIPEVTGKILAKVIEYCKKHVDAATAASVVPSASTSTAAAASRSAAPNASASSLSPAEQELKKWDEDFIKVDTITLLQIINAASFLNMDGLLELACETVADTIKDFSPEEVRSYFSIENDFTAEEEAKVREETKGAFT